MAPRNCSRTSKLWKGFICDSRRVRGRVLVARAVIKKQLQDVRAIEGVYLRPAPLKGEDSRGSRRYQEAAHCMPCNYGPKRPTAPLK